MNQKKHHPDTVDDETMTVTLNLDEGDVECSIATILTANGRDYIALVPQDENGDDIEGEVWFYRYSENEDNPNEEPLIEYIDDDEEYESVVDAFDEYLDNLDFNS